MRKSNCIFWIFFPQFSGWKFKKSIWNHHPKKKNQRKKWRRNKSLMGSHLQLQKKMQRLGMDDSNGLFLGGLGPGGFTTSNPDIPQESQSLSFSGDPIGIQPTGTQTTNWPLDGWSFTKKNVLNRFSVSWFHTFLIHGAKGSPSKKTNERCPVSVSGFKAPQNKNTPKYFKNDVIPPLLIVLQWHILFFQGELRHNGFHPRKTSPKDAGSWQVSRLAPSWYIKPILLLTSCRPKS